MLRTYRSARPNARALVDQVVDIPRSRVVAQLAADPRLTFHPPAFDDNGKFRESRWTWTKSASDDPSQEATAR